MLLRLRLRLHLHLHAHSSSFLPVRLPACLPVSHTHRYVAQVAQINALELSLRALTDAELAEQTLRFKAALELNRHR